MEFKRFKLFNDIGGWVMFLIATSVYTLTMEATASLWDCGEFIASAYKLQVVHPPGAPTFLMIGRLFSLLAMGDVDLVPVALNFMSAVCSGFAMMFLFWITTYLAGRILDIAKDAQSIEMGQAVAILGAGAVAALSGTFLTSVWFSAVEGEVYSMSLMFTALVFWAIFKWESKADELYGDRWLLFIAFLVGFTIFIHWLNLLAIPAIVFVYYFKRYEYSRKGTAIAMLVSIGILGFILGGIITGIIDIIAFFELMFVNEFGLPFNSGLIFSLLLLIGGLTYALWYTYKNEKAVAHNILLALLFILMGYSTVTVTVIRSNSDPNIDMNNPDDIIALATYLKREQYGSRPFLTGYYYNDQIVNYKKIGTKYQRGEKKYDVVGDKIDYVRRGKSKFFPRIYDPSHKDRYERGLGLGKNEKPTFSDNIHFFLRYQIGHMYVRYFMWNFVGRQNDDQGTWGSLKDGNWVSGISLIDSMWLGSPQSDLPEHLKSTPTRNTYFFIPFLLGLLGMVFHFTEKRKHAFAVLLLFLFSGVAIIVQGNSPPIEPRERDYIFAASFWTFCIWLGLGVVALYDVFKRKGMGAAAGAVAIGLLAPLLMGTQNWNDHDRSDRYAARDFAANYLNSCAPNAIIFTQGDNDTYPLWYAQEVEGIRRDVRVVNLSLLGVDWYINQLQRKVNDAEPVPMTLTPDKIRGTNRDLVPVYANPNIAPEGKYVSLLDVMGFVADDSKGSKVGEESSDYIPTRNLELPVNAQELIQQGAIAPEDISLIDSPMQWQIPAGKSSLYKNDLMVYDIIAAIARDGWKRPIYFAISVSNSSYMGLEKYFQLEGLAYRVVPIPTKSEGPYMGRVNPSIMYNNLMNRFKFGNINNPEVHVDTDLRRMIFNFRGNYSRLAEALIERGYNEKAVEVLDKSIEVMPDAAAPFNIYMYSTIQNYYDAGAFDKANALVDEVSDRLIAELKYYNELSPAQLRAYKQDQKMNQDFIMLFIGAARERGQTEFAEKLEEKLANV